MQLSEILEKTAVIPSSVHEPEQKMWLERLKDLPGSPVIVDFGTGWCKSGVSLALACPQGKVYTFDIGDVYINHTCSAEEYMQKVNDYIKQSGATNIEFTRENSLTKSWNCPIDVLNIDSDHTYETTIKELNIWVRRVKPNGLIFCHDYDHPKCPGVRQALDEYIAENKNLELLEVSGQPSGIQCACFRKL